jgi:glycosyltransferase involved in cell wall biosynthesis
MRVGFLINTCEPFYRGGYERRAWAFARELVRQGHEVRIYTSCPRDETIEGVRFIRLGSPRVFFNRRGVRNGAADLLFALNIGRLFWKLRPGELDLLDVCATPFLHLPLAAFIARWKRIPLVLTCHEALLAALGDYARERGHRNSVTGKFVALVLAGIYRAGMSCANRRLAVSPRTAAALTREEFPAAAVIEFGLEPEAFSAGPGETRAGEPVRFIFCGRLTPVKSVDVTVAALLALRAEGESFRFDIIGEGSERARLEEKVALAGATDVILSHGELSEEAKRELLSRSEVFVLSSPREGFSIATLEAMGRGCCAVVVVDPARPNGALDFVRDGQEGLCVAPGLGPMQEALRRLIREPALRLRLRRAAWETAREYRIERQARRLAEFYSGGGRGG